MFREDSFWLQSIDLDCVSHGIELMLAEARSVSQVRVDSGGAYTISRLLFWMKWSATALLNQAKYP